MPQDIHRPLRAHSRGTQSIRRAAVHFPGVGWQREEGAAKKAVVQERQLALQDYS